MRKWRNIVSKGVFRYEADCFALYTVKQVHTRGGTPYVAAVFHTGADGTFVECEELLTSEVAPTSVENPKFLGGTPC